MQRWWRFCWKSFTELTPLPTLKLPWCLFKKQRGKNAGVVAVNIKESHTTVQREMTIPHFLCNRSIMIRSRWIYCENKKAVKALQLCGSVRKLIFIIWYSCIKEKPLHCLNFRAYKTYFYTAPYKHLEFKRKKGKNGDVDQWCSLACKRPMFNF